ncbi:YheC/YheD family protein [Paenibacillus sonchi]|uniref:YheC/YheD family protein n=1 Tax=Paenibacillus sonchi TaxID=373687 RepID=UPI00398A7986
MKEQIRRISNKLTKTRVLARSQELRSHIPATKRMNQSVLQEMLQKYQMVYVKPCCGSLGQGVIRVEKTAGSSLRSKNSGKHAPGTVGITAIRRVCKYTTFLTTIRHTGPFIRKPGEVLSGTKRNPAPASQGPPL